MKTPKAAINMQIDREMNVKRALNVETLHILKHSLLPGRKQIQNFIYFHFDIQIFPSNIFVRTEIFD